MKQYLASCSSLVATIVALATLCGGCGRNDEIQDLRHRVSALENAVENERAGNRLLSRLLSESLAEQEAALKKVALNIAINEAATSSVTSRIEDAEEKIGEIEKKATDMGFRLEAVEIEASGTAEEYEVTDLSKRVDAIEWKLLLRR